MRMAINLAKKASGLTSPNPLVGSVIVSNGNILSRGYHKKAGSLHAEAEALEKLKTDKTDLTLYVNLEPCSHFGRTPPCADRIIKSGKIKRVVIGITDPNPLVSGKGIKKLEDAGIKVTQGVLKKESAVLNEAFIKHITYKVPFVILKSAVSLDGKIAAYTGNSRWITGEKARKEVHRIRSECDAVITGAGTVIKDDPELTARNIKSKKQPMRVIVDSRGRISLKSRVLNAQDKAKTVIAATEKIPEKKLKSFRNKKIEVLICREKNSRVDLKDLLKKLGKRGIISVLLEGGGELNSSFLNEKLVDKLKVFIAPKIIGGKDAPGFVQGRGIELVKNAYELSEFSIKKFGDDLLIETYVKDNYKKIFNRVL